MIVIGVGMSVHKTDGVARFERFCEENGLDFMILGEGMEWSGGDMEKGPGGGQKINELKAALEGIDNKLIIFCDTFDLFPVSGPKEIYAKYQSLCPNNEILFASEIYCWPDRHVAEDYPPVSTVYKYLNSGSFMGYRDDIIEMISGTEIDNTEDDQRYYTRKYLESNGSVKLDSGCQIFQALNGAYDHISVHKSRVYNSYTSSYPIFIHGNGLSKLHLNMIENYVGDVDINSTLLHDRSNTTTNAGVFVAMFIDDIDASYFSEFCDSMRSLQKANSRSVFYAYGKNPEDHDIGRLNSMDIPLDHISDNRYSCYADFIESGCEYLCTIDQKCIIKNPDTIDILIGCTDRTHRIISPMLRLAGDSWYANFWGALDSNKYYKRSDDYASLINRKLTGIWNVPYVSGIILFTRDIIMNWDLTKSNIFDSDPEMKLCENIRNYTLFMYMINTHDYGYIARD